MIRVILSASGIVSLAPDKILFDMTIQEILNVPARAYGENVGLFDGIIIIPTRKDDPVNDKDDYRQMTIVGYKDEKPFKVLSEISDIVFLKDFPTSIHIDCLPTSGCLRVFPSRPRRLYCDNLNGNIGYK